MTHEKSFHEVGGLLWLSGFSAEEAALVANKLSEWPLRVAVMDGYHDCVRRSVSSEMAGQDWKVTR